MTDKDSTRQNIVKYLRAIFLINQKACRTEFWVGITIFSFLFYWILQPETFEFIVQSGIPYSYIVFSTSIMLGLFNLVLNRARDVDHHIIWPGMVFIFILWSSYPVKTFLKPLHLMLEGNMPFKAMVVSTGALYLTILGFLPSRSPRVHDSQMSPHEETHETEKKDPDYSIAITVGILIAWVALSIGPGNIEGGKLETKLSKSIQSDKKVISASHIFLEEATTYDKVCIFLDDDSFLEVAEEEFQEEHGIHPGTKEGDRNAIITLSNSNTGMLKTYLLDNIYIRVKSDKYWLKFGDERKNSGCLSYKQASFKAEKGRLDYYLIMSPL